MLISLLHLIHAVLDRLVEVLNRTAVAFRHIFGLQHEICCCKVICNRDVINDGNSKQCLYIRIVRLCLSRIPEEYHEVNLSFYDLGTDLLVSA